MTNLRRHKLPAAFWVIMLAGMIIRAGLPWAAGFKKGFYLSPDSNDYLVVARSLLEGRFYNEAGPEIKRTPGYPVFLAAGFGLHHPIAFALAGQVILATVSVIIVYLVARAMALSQRTALVAMGLMAADPLQVIYCWKILSETLFTFSLLVFIWAFTQWLNGPRRTWLITAGLSLTCATFIRPVSYYLALLFPPVIAVLSGILQRRPRYAVETLLIAGLCVSPLFAWQLRNRAAAGYRGFSAIQETNLYFYNAAALTARQEGVGFYRKQQELGFNHPIRFRDSHPGYPDLNDAAVYTYLKRDALRIIGQDPLGYAVIHLQGIVRMLIDPDLAELFRMTGRYPESGGLLGEMADRGLTETLRSLMARRPLFFWSNCVVGLVLAILYLAAGIALITRLNSGRAYWLLTGLLAYFLAISGGPAALGRFRHPVIPVLILIAALLLDRKPPNARSKKGRHPGDNSL